MFPDNHHLEPPQLVQMGQPAFVLPQRQYADNLMPYKGDVPPPWDEAQYEDPFRGEMQAQG